MCTYFKTETDVAQILIDEFLSNFDSFTVRGPFYRKDFFKKIKKICKIFRKRQYVWLVHSQHVSLLFNIHSINLNIRSMNKFKEI